MNDIIRVERLSKQFAEIKAVDQLSFSVRKGEVYGFLGQNGAGKSTTIRMLLTLIRPGSGTIRIFGKNVFHERSFVLRQTGAIIEKPDLYKYLTAYQNLQIIAKLSGADPGKGELLKKLERVGIGDRAHSKVKTFSQGMKQRLGIACALVHDPQLIILDEPTNGLDPQGIADIRNLILHLSREEGRTVLVSSHILSEMELIADSMLIIDQGRKMAEGRVAELLNPAHTLVEVETGDNAAARSLLNTSRWQSFLQSSSALQLKMHRSDVPELVSFLTGNGVGIFSIQAKHSLEDYFLSLTKANQHVAAYRN
ncbi:MAG TPA: ABC transporter ATP-binding protein [Flavisolibacter sp.]|nr:ABC transporter ATP-binding protein [Flavisolibacter sp.]